MSAVPLISSLILISFAIGPNNGSFTGNLAYIIVLFTALLILFIPVFFRSKKRLSLSFLESALIAIVVFLTDG